MAAPNVYALLYNYLAFPHPTPNVEKAVASLKEATALYLSKFPLPSLGHPVVTMFTVPEPAGAKIGARLARRRSARTRDAQLTHRNMTHDPQLPLPRR